MNDKDKDQERIFARRMARELQPSEMDRVAGGGPWTGHDGPGGGEVSNPFVDWDPSPPKV